MVQRSAPSTARIHREFRFLSLSRPKRARLHGASPASATERTSSKRICADRMASLPPNADYQIGRISRDVVKLVFHILNISSVNRVETGLPVC